MKDQVIADIEIEDQKISYYSTIVIRQRFNAHHEFMVRIKYDVLEKLGSFGMSNTQKLIGKSAVIKLKQAGSQDLAYEFRGIICEIGMEQSDNFTSDLVLRGYSPTILLESGPHLTSFYKNSLQQIAQSIIKPVTEFDCKVNVNPKHKSALTYICQYKESAFGFLNRLSANYGEWFYYDGKELHFGKPSKSPSVEVTYGVDVQNMQLSMRILPMTFSNYSYVSRDDKMISASAPSSVDGLDQYGSIALKESNRIFSTPVNYPLPQRADSKGDLDNFVKQQKAALAAGLEVLTGTSDNPSICIGAVASVKVSVLGERAVSKEDCGNFLITAIEHHLTANGKYSNNFEGIPAGLEVIPVKNVVEPIAEPQVATVMDNADPDNLGRIRVQMLWQQPGNKLTDWLRVMTPDAGSSGQVNKNRGFVFIPEIGDQVIVAFSYNDVDRPFVLGSLFHGKIAAGGGDGNNKKVLNSKSGHMIELVDTEGKETITVTDKKKNKIVVSTADDSISITANGAINMTASSINMLAKGAITMNAGAAIEGAAGTMVTFGAGISTSLVSARDTVILAGKMLSASGGKNVKVGSGAGAKIELEAKGEAKFSSSKKMDIRSKDSCVTGSDKATFKSKKAFVEGSDKAVVKGRKVDIS